MRGIPHWPLGSPTDIYIGASLGFRGLRQMIRSRGSGLASFPTTPHFSFPDFTAVARQGGAPSTLTPFFRGSGMEILSVLDKWGKDSPAAEASPSFFIF